MDYSDQRESRMARMGRSRRYQVCPTSDLVATERSDNSSSATHCGYGLFGPREFWRELCQLRQASTS